MLLIDLIITTCSSKQTKSTVHVNNLTLSARPTMYVGLLVPTHIIIYSVAQIVQDQ